MSGADPNGECPKCMWSLRPDGTCQNPDCELFHYEEAALTIVCSGPPYCSLRGDAAVEAQKKGCPWCARIHTEEDGREFVEQPGLA